MMKFEVLFTTYQINEGLKRQFHASQEMYRKLQEYGLSYLQKHGVLPPQAQFVAKVKREASWNINRTALQALATDVRRNLGGGLLLKPTDFPVVTFYRVKADEDEILLPKLGIVKVNAHFKYTILHKVRFTIDGFAFIDVKPI